jgi:hypothetical protein
MQQEAMETILSAIHTVLEGDVYLIRPMQKEMLQELLRGHPVSELDPFESLTDRELEVFRRLGQAQSTREIATKIHLSAKTIQSHRGLKKSSTCPKAATSSAMHSPHSRTLCRRNLGPAARFTAIAHGRLC